MKISKNLILLNIISLLIFIFILIEILYKGFIVNWDLSINSLILTIENNFLTILSKTFSFIFDTTSIIIISLVILIYLWFKDSKKDSIFFAIAMILDLAIIFILKEMAQRARPLNSLIFETGFAFPSGHSTTTVVFFGSLTYLILSKNKLKSIRLTTILISVFTILLIGFTRLYLNVHWLTDILGGFAIGTFILTGSIIVKQLID